MFGSLEGGLLTQKFTKDNSISFVTVSTPVMNSRFTSPPEGRPSKSLSDYRWWVYCTGYNQRIQYSGTAHSLEHSLTQAKHVVNAFDKCGVIHIKNLEVYGT